MDYRWQLRKGSRKEICPRCGQKRFVPYVLAADGVTIAGEEFGRCDREQNCGYFRYPSEVNAEPVRKIEMEEKNPIRFYKAAVATSYDSSLFVWAARLVGVTKAMQAFSEYKIGVDNGRAVFWQIDKDGEVRGAKSIPYLDNGHRDKSDKYPAIWLHASKKWKGMFEGEELEQCFFGEHLLKDSQKPVAVVESEKTALMMSVWSKNYIWLACGGSQGLKNEKRNEALKGRDVLLIPDNGQYWNWRGIADKNKWQCTSAIEKFPFFEGCDILDMVEAGAFGDDLLKNKTI